MKQNFKIRKRSYTVRFVALSMALVFCMTSCGKKQENVPELLEPITTNEAYRPVTKGDVGKRVIKNGSVVPTDYCYFFKSSVTISKIYVNVGDYVEKGTVLAEADSDETEEGIEELKASLSSMQQTHAINEKIFEQNQKEIDYKIKACQEAGDSEGEKEYRNTKAVNAENNRYDNMLYNYQIKKIQTQIDEKEELETDNKLVAEQSGYVTYTKSLTGEGDDGTASNTENIVIISDYSDPYIEITGEKITKDGYASYKTLYTMIDGKRYELEEYKYSNQEIAAAQSVSKLPYVRFKLKDADNKSILKTGTTIPLYFSTSSASQVLVIGNDSLYEEGDKNFVYVKTDSSDKEKRDIVIGATDENYTEVVSGLEEGELVYYDSDSTLPSNYTTYEVSLDNFRKTGTSKLYKMVDTNQITYSAPADGYFTKFELAEGQEVKKGDLLFTVDSGGGSAELMELNSQISDAKSEYDSSVAEYDSQIADLRKQIREYQSGKKTQQAATPGDADGENTLYMVEQLTCQIEVAKYNKELAKINYNATVNPLIAKRDKLNENNDGQGNISVYAENDGVIQSVFASTGYQLKEGDKVVSIGSDEAQMMSLSLNSENNSGSGMGGMDGGDSGSDDDETPKLLINQEVTLVDQKDDSKQLSGRCIGATADAQKSYVTTIGDLVYVTTSSASDETRYFIEVDDESFYDSPKGYFVSYALYSLENIVTVPANLIYHEKNKVTGKEYDYVWKIIGDEIVKQYVTIGKTYASTSCILTGLSEGDLIAKETAESSTMSDDKNDSSK